MEVIDLNIDANVVVPETVNVSGEVRANPINAGVTSIVINGVEQEIDQGQVSFSVPTKVSDVENDLGFIDRDVNDLTNYPRTNQLSEVAFSGSYNDLENKPSIPVVPTNVSSFTNDAGYITKDVNNLTNYTKSSDLAAVATSGSYNDLSNKPQIPSKTIVNVTQIQSSGEKIATVTVDGNPTDIYAPVASTEVVITDTLQSGTKIATINVDGTPTEIKSPKIPSNVSAFNNDSGYITSSALSGLASETYVTNAVSNHNSSGTAHTDIRNSISTINEKIPSAASTQNQLADKAFVNSTINSMAAFFRGTFATQLDLLSVQWQTSDPDAPNYVSNNDYAYVREVVAGSAIGTWDPEDHLGEAWRFLYVMGEGWQPQFMVNETPFTQVQLDAINSGITSNDVAQIGTNTAAIAGKQNEITSSNKLSASLVSGLSSVATSGSYNDLSNKPDLSVYAQSASLATVATSGDYDDLDNKPTIPTVPTDVSAFTNDAGYITKSVNDLTNYTPTSSLATVATSGAYSDLSGTPDLSVYAQSASLATVATSGDYDDLENKPTIPVVPTDVSAFTNDAGYITTADTPVVSPSTNNVAMDPNKYYDFGTLSANTTVTFTAGTAGYVSEYMGVFTAASTYTFTFPASVTWSDSWTLTAGNTYEFSVVNNKGIMVEYPA